MKNITLNEEQIEAINHIEGPLLVLAGAGSGKTRVVTHKIANLIELGVPPSDILAVTFTNKAADEMAGRIRKLTYKNVLTCTFHSLGAKILRESIHELGYSNNFTIYDEEDSLKLFKSCLENLQIKDEKGFLKTVRYKISSLKNDFVDLSDINCLAGLEKQEIDVLSLYQKKLKSFNAVDFDDLLYLTATLFKTNEKILNKYQKRWSFILIDEYQDTNSAQYTIAKLLSLKHQNICVVGDPDQSIYSWRGAKYQNILNFDKDFSQNVKIIKLEKNYRSTSTILNASNELIKNNKSRLEKNLQSTLGEGENISVFFAENDDMEVNYVVEKILKYIHVKKIDPNEIAIFYRTNFQSRKFEDILLSQNVPYQIYGGISFYQRKEIKDILSFLKLIISDSDFLSFSRTINIFKGGFGKKTLDTLFFLAEKKVIPIMKLLKMLIKNPKSFDEIKLNSTQMANLKIYLDNFEKLKKILLQNLDLDEMITEVISIFNYFDYLKEDPETFEDRKENIDELISKAAKWLEDNENSLEKFIEELTLITTTTKDADKTSTIKMMTLHNSKGLEFESVFIVGLEEDLFPHVNSKNSFEEIEEERRLLYVGMTRAKKYLHLTSAQYRYMFGKIKITAKSRFLKELPEKYLNKVNASYSLDSEEEKSSIDNIADSFHPGQKVSHKTFGVGIVQKVYSGSLGETLDILFEENITRSLVVKYAKLI
ncbi:MAG: UvrD-helicase domain-containing protein, partial [Parachlamydiales bacterium]|nr:UvrD-helicase domain-containing protein [Parachlamydiales bacterium]